MPKIYGALRIALIVLIVFLAFLAVLITSLIPYKVRGLTLAMWSVNIAVRVLCFTFGVHVHSPDPQAIRSHAGLVFPNHQSTLDVLALYYCAPMRFLAADDNEHRFLLGRIISSVGTVFVQRNSPRSRLEARNKVAEALRENNYPPIVLFPEGRLGTGDALFAFRHGAFGIAVEVGAAYLPLAIGYKQKEIVVWRAAAEHEGMWSHIWRMVQYPKRIDVDVIPLPVVRPCADDDPKELAAIAREDIAKTLGLPLELPNLR